MLLLVSVVQEFINYLLRTYTTVDSCEGRLKSCVYSLTEYRFAGSYFCVAATALLYCCYWFCTRYQLMSLLMLTLTVIDFWLYCISLTMRIRLEAGCVLRSTNLFCKRVSLISSGRNFVAQLKLCAPVSPAHRRDLCDISWQRQCSTADLTVHCTRAERLLSTSCT